MEMVSVRGVGSNPPMAETLKSLQKRLSDTVKALELTPAELCRVIDISESRWSNYTTGDRKITLEIANKLCDEFGLTLDWIYRGNPAGLPHAIRIKLPPRAA